MNVISRRAIREAQFANPRCRNWLEEWWRTVQREQWTSLHDIRQTYASADQVGRYLVFDGPEGKRLIVGVRYAHDDPPAGGTLYVKHFLTHREYDRGTWKRS